MPSSRAPSSALCCLARLRLQTRLAGLHVCVARLPLGSVVLTAAHLFGDHGAAPRRGSSGKEVGVVLRIGGGGSAIRRKALLSPRHAAQNNRQTKAKTGY